MTIAVNPWPEKRYLGDGAYVEFDGFQIVLTTENGISVTNTVALEPQVWVSLQRFANDLEEWKRTFVKEKP